MLFSAGEVWLFLSVVLVHLPQLQECMKTTIYVEEPSSYNLTCNPYGSAVQIPCVIQEPLSLKLASQLLLFWYWTPPGATPTADACQIYPQYQCDQYVGKTKYDFVFRRSFLNNNDSISLRRVDLAINDVGVEDQGCYNCRPWINSSPLPVDESSDVFCLEPIAFYQHLPPCDIVSSNGNPITSTITVTSTIPVVIQSSITDHTPIATPSSTSSITLCDDTMNVVMSANQNDEASDEEHVLYTVAYSVGGACVCLCVLSFVLFMIIVWQWYDRSKDNSSRTTSHLDLTSTAGSRNKIISWRQNTNTDDSVMTKIGTTGVERRDSSSDIQPTVIISKCPETCDELEGVEVKENNPIGGNCDNIATADEASCYSLSVLQSPRPAHVYQTLDKYLEELLQNSNNESLIRNGVIQNTTVQGEQQLFDDPNYSSVEIRNTQFLPFDPAPPPEDLATVKLHPGSLATPTLDPVPPRRVPVLTRERTYDKLEPRTSEAEYSYAYSHIMKLKKKLKKLQSMEESGSSDAGSIQLELVQIAAMAGSAPYDIDPSLLTSLMSLSGIRLSEEVRTNIERTTSRQDGGITISLESNRGTAKPHPVHQYQSLNKRTRNIENGYAHLVK